jgi:cytochrome d ubiquinol oxidase subunit II
LFSGFYLVLIPMLVALILRGVSFEFRGKHQSKGWRSFWDWAIFTGSLLPALLWGLTIGNLMRGFAIQQDMNYFGGLLPLLNPYALLGGLVFVTLFLMHGANFLGLKAPQEIAERARKVAFVGWIAATVLTVAFIVWTFFATDLLMKPGLNGLIPALLAAALLLVTGWLVRMGKSGWAFVTGALTIVFATTMVFAGLYPRILISTLDPGWSLTITNAASSHYTLKVMTIVAALFVPIVLAYQGWNYWVFRKRVEAKPEKLIY